MKPHVMTADGKLLETLFRIYADRKKTQIRQLLQYGSVLVNGSSITKHDHPLKPGDRVEIRDKRASIKENLKPALGLKVIYEDDALLVVEKPEGLLTMGNDDTKEETLYWKLTAYVRSGSKGGKGRVFIVHRLDRDASGLLVFAKTEDIKRNLQENWDKFTKKYYAVVEGAPEPPAGVIDNYLLEDKVNLVHLTKEKTPGALRAISKYRILKRIEDLSLVQVELVTGRKNQIRVHMADTLKCPISGDDKYGAKTKCFRRLALHCYFLSFTHPVKKEVMTFTTPVPPLFLSPLRPRRQDKALRREAPRRRPAA